MSVLGLIFTTVMAMAALAWVGWHFFLPPAPSEAPAAVSRPRANAAEQGKRRPSFGWSAVLAVLVTAATVAAVLALGGHIGLDPLSVGELQRGVNIRAALNPEKLVPPPPLPAAMFLGTDVVALETADRDWSRLDRQFQQLALLVFARMEARGYPLALLEGYRSPERQDMLAGLGVNVTQARAYQSRHQYGLALDAAPISAGRLVISERDPWAMAAYQALGQEAERVGLVWGGRWNMRDYGHIEMPRRQLDAAGHIASAGI